ncbi:hypothetical protein F8388_023846 [Cannabis sativa]|uniref:Fatty acyl-CoA reductase n=1 Tax=Cannabis sativa TaxID=3483 RepID=A0A7J6GCH6_CANSA|nr:hypothetical protein F8388_023846 [Cannabis sativa]
MRFLENKTILVTGAAGFLAKLLVEKILRVSPNVKKIYLLLRTSDTNSARHRMHNEVIEKEVFRVLREERGKDFDEFIEQKLEAIGGDISFEDLRIEDIHLRHQIWDNLDIIINSAATTDFYERYDYSLSINTMGVVHILNFAKKCRKKITLLHISTAYVCGEVEGVIEERAFEIGGTLKKSRSSNNNNNNNNNKLDFELEKQLVQQKLYQLQQQQASQQTITTTMKEFGIQRTVDSVIIGYAKGKVTCFLGNPKLILDLIPADMVVNAVFMAIQAQDKKDSGIIYQVGSSMRNPINISQIYNSSFRYFTENPLISKIDKKPIRVGKLTFFKTLTTFQIYLTIRFILPLKIWYLISRVIWYGDSKDKYSEYMKKINSVIHLVQLYKPYVLFNGIFDDLNLERLRQNAKDESEDEALLLNCDPKCIVWEDYMINTHIPGLLNYVYYK